MVAGQHKGKRKGRTLEVTMAPDRQAKHRATEEKRLTEMSSSIFHIFDYVGNSDTVEQDL